MLFTCISTLFIIATTYFCVNYYNNYTYIKNNITDTITLDDLIYKAKSGDIIYFKSDLYNLNTIFGSHLVGPFTHIGMVFVIEDIKYIIELTDSTTLININITTPGIHLTPLEKRFTNYRGKIFLSTLSDFYKIDDNKVKKVTQKITQNFYKNTLQYPDSMRKYYLTHIIKKWFNIKIKKYNDNTMICSEFVKYMLRELGVLNKKENHKGILPSDFRILKDPSTFVYLYANLFLVK